MQVLKAISRAVARLNRWLAPTVAAESMMQAGGGTGGTHVDPLALDLLKSELERDRSDE